MSAPAEVVTVTTLALMQVENRPFQTVAGDAFKGECRAPVQIANRMSSFRMAYSVPVILMTRYLAVPPATVMLASIEHGVLEHVAPPPEKLWTTGAVPCTVPAAQDAVPHVSAPVSTEVPEPPVRIGVTVGLPASAQHATVVIDQSVPVSLLQATGESLSFARTGDADPGSPTITTQDLVRRGAVTFVGPTAFAAIVIANDPALFVTSPVCAGSCAA